MRRNKSSSFWLAAVILIATFAAEPKASAEFTKDALVAVGEFGGALVVEMVSDEDQAAF